ncbi:MAG: Arginine biosynthesis bifunctional protein ArgJ [candidate division BRC1 bacterium ADurb.BinA364]|nr:MAG: Arginine biosynthesis bifunctional protein ArgJ [candidate division BRC1 bacterium ADurb.BinA364]
MALIVSETLAAAAGTTTRNRFFSPAVAATRKRLERGALRAIAANAKFSNAATGERGLRDSERMAACAAEALGLDPMEVAVASTGVIGQFMPMEKIEAGIAAAARALRPDGWSEAAQAIMTTDTRPKEAGRSIRLGSAQIALRGIAKGVGMIHPNMGTMLSFIATDARADAGVLRSIVRGAVDRTFNSVTVDGDTSTSDTFIVMANGAAGGPAIAPGSAEEREFAAALEETMRELAVMLAADGEGATKVIEVTVGGARSESEAREAARKVASSSLVKTAVHGNDANWGRVCAALGNAQAEFDQANVRIAILGVPVMERGLPTPYDEPPLQAEMRRRDRIVIEVDLGAGPAKATAWGSDLSAEYIRINADYRT